MTREQAIYYIVGDIKDPSDSQIEKAYKKKVTLLKSQHQSAPTDPLIEKYQSEINNLNEAYQIASGLPSLVPPVKKTRNQSIKDDLQIDDKDGAPKDVKGKKKPSFFESLMHKGVFFLVLTSLTAAILLLIMWTGARGNLDDLEGMSKALENRSFSIYNAGEKDYTLTGFLAFYYDDESKQIQKYETYDLKVQLKAGKATDVITVDSADLKNLDYTGEVLFFQIIYVDKNGNPKVYADYAGSHKASDRFLKLQLD